MSEIQDQDTLKTKKYYVAVRQMQYFEIDIDENDLPLTEDSFWEKYYSLQDC